MQVTRVKSKLGTIVRFASPPKEVRAPAFSKGHPLVTLMAETAAEFISGTRGGITVRRVRDGRVHSETRVEVQHET